MMAIKVFIQTEKFKGGPAVFRSRLISELRKREGIKVTTNLKDKFDIELAFIRRVHKHDRPYILRIDGCYYQKNRKSNNRLLEKAIIGSRHLIFQSEFSFELCRKVLDIGDRVNDPSSYSIVHNGIDLDYVNRIKPDDAIEPGSFVSCARWRDNKRTFSIIKGFLKADVSRHLYMIGGVGMGEKQSYRTKMKKYRSNRVHILGAKKEEEIISILKSCSYQIHLCHIDSCPNIVVEGLSCGLNVLCSNLGGTRELVKKDGVILDVDKLWKGKYLSSSVVLDNVKSGAVAKGIHRLMQLETSPDASRFDISRVTDEYVSVIKGNV